VSLDEASLETGTLSNPVTLMSCGHPHSPLAQPVEEADRDKIRCNSSIHFSSRR